MNHLLSAGKWSGTEVEKDPMERYWSWEGQRVAQSSSVAQLWMLVFPLQLELILTCLSSG